MCIRDRARFKCLKLTNFWKVSLVTSINTELQSSLWLWISNVLRLVKPAKAAGGKCRNLQYWIRNSSNWGNCPKWSEDIEDSRKKWSAHRSCRRCTTVTSEPLGPIGDWSVLKKPNKKKYSFNFWNWLWCLNLTMWIEFYLFTHLWYKIYWNGFFYIS